MKKLIFSLVTLILVNASAAQANDNSSHVWTEQEVANLYQTNKSSIDQDDANNALDWGYVFYCQSQSYVTGAWYYWYSYNLGVARYNALALCVQNNGYTCTVGCR